MERRLKTVLLSRRSTKLATSAARLAPEARVASERTSVNNCEFRKPHPLQVSRNSIWREHCRKEASKLKMSDTFSIANPQRSE